MYGGTNLGANSSQPGQTGEQKLKRCSLHLYSSLELGRLNFNQRRIFNKCLERIQLPIETVTDQQVDCWLAQAGYDPWHSPDLNREFMKVQDFIRVQWHALIISLSNDEQEVEIRCRLGLIQKVLTD